MRRSRREASPEDRRSKRRRRHDEDRHDDRRTRRRNSSDSEAHRRHRSDKHVESQRRHESRQSELGHRGHRRDLSGDRRKKERSPLASPRENSRNASPEPAVVVVPVEDTKEQILQKERLERFRKLKQQQVADDQPAAESVPSLLPWQDDLLEVEDDPVAAERRRKVETLLRQPTKESKPGDEDSLDEFMKVVMDEVRKTNLLDAGDYSEDLPLGPSAASAVRSVSLADVEALNEAQGREVVEEPEMDYHANFIRAMKGVDVVGVSADPTPPVETGHERVFSEDEDEVEFAISSQDSSALRLESYFDIVKKIPTKKELAAVDHSTIDYDPFVKNLYVQVRELTAMTDHEVDAYRKTHGNIKIRGRHCPRPILSFFQCGLPDKILQIIEKRNYEAPFPIQMQALPALMSGRDVLGVAETGSGKTLAYMLPLIRHVLAQRGVTEGQGPIGLIMTPTRELALQISNEAKKLAKVVDIRVLAVYGGASIGEQLSALRRGVEIVVCTPGRMIDVLTISNGKVTNLKRITFLILDEADRMFDLGFEPQISAIAKNIRPDRQTALFSATFPQHVENLARRVLRKPLEIIVGEKGRTAAHVQQYVEVRPDGEKLLRLLQLLGEWSDHGQIIIFVARQTDADNLFVLLLNHGYDCLVLHGGQDQTDREFTLQDFKDGVKSILIATSVAARGLDVKAVVLVVNYTCPDHLEDYVHRIGRTGRAGNVGVAYTFISPEEAEKAEDLLKALTQSGQPVPDQLAALSNEFKVQCNLGLAKQRKGKGFGGRGFKFTEAEQSRQQKDRSSVKKELGIDGDGGEDEVADDTSGDVSVPSAFQTTDLQAAIPAAPNPLLLEGATVASVSQTPVVLRLPTDSSQPWASATTVILTDAENKGAAMTAAERAQQLAENLVKERMKMGTATQADMLRLLGNRIKAPANSLTSLANAALAAQAVVGNTFLSVPGLSPTAYRDSSTGNYVDQYVINDFPPNARIKLTHRELLNRVTEITGVLLQVKGQYLSPDIKKSDPILAARSRPLFIEMIAPTIGAIQRAKSECRMLVEAVMGIRPGSLPTVVSPTRPVGRYSVV